MYLSEFLASCRRLKGLAALLLVGTAVLTFLAFRAVPPDYNAEASVVLIPPKTTEDLAANRYLELGSLSSSVDVLSRSMVSADTARMLENEVPLAEYDVTPDPTTSAPIVLMSATSSDPAAADRMLTLLLREIPKTLNELQAEIDVQPENRITTQVVAQDPRPEVTHKARVRLVAVLGAGLLFASGVLLAAVDGLLIRRSRRREALRERVLAGSTRRRPVPPDTQRLDAPPTRKTASPQTRNGSGRTGQPAGKKSTKKAPTKKATAKTPKTTRKPTPKPSPRSTRKPPEADRQAHHLTGGQHDRAR